ncbi:hypothetical protein DFH27DRAFT_559765 [Peziza echinospora]|nr:hypothetical protein DFH27DRAFT_559765 [Peziza echinospora]
MANPNPVRAQPSTLRRLSFFHGLVMALLCISCFTAVLALAPPRKLPRNAQKHIPVEECGEDAFRCGPGNLCCLKEFDDCCRDWLARPFVWKCCEKKI